jgi:hypothetical protein
MVISTWGRFANLLFALMVFGLSAPCIAQSTGTWDFSQDSTDVDSSPEAQDLRSSSQFDFGAFCIDHIPLGAVTSVSRPALKTDGYWRSVTLTVRDGDRAHPHVFFLSGSPRVGGVFQACTGKPGPGIARILDGDIQSGSITFWILSRPLGSFGLAEQVEDGKMDLVLSHATPQFAPLYGGTVSGTRIKVTNVGRFVDNPQRLDVPGDGILAGMLEVGSRALKITGAMVQLPGAAGTITADFAPGPEGASVLVTVPSGEVALNRGVETTATPITSPANWTMQAAGLGVAGHDWKINKVELHAYAGKQPPSIAFEGLSVTATHLNHDVPLLMDAYPTGPISASRIEGPLSKDLGMATPATSDVYELIVPAADLALGGAPSNPAVQGLGRINLHVLTDATVDAECLIATPQLRTISAITPVGGSNLVLHITGNKTAPDLAGQMSLSSITLGSLSLAGMNTVLAKFSRLGSTPGEIGIPFTLKTSTPSGTWQLQAPGGPVKLSGMVSAVRTSGTAWFGAGDNSPRLEVNPGAFELAASGTAVQGSLLFGAPAATTQISANIDVLSPGGFLIAGTGGTKGGINLSAAILVVDQPQVAFEVDDPGRFLVHAPIRFDTGVTLSLDLANLATRIQKGHAEIDGASATAVDPAIPFTISGIQVTAPDVVLGSLVVDVQGGTGVVTVGDLSAQASSIAHSAAPQWSATTAAFSVHSISATLAQADKALQLQDASLAVLRVTGANGGYTSQDGFHIDGQKVAVGTDAATRTSVTNATISIARGNLDLNSASNGTTITAGANYDGFQVTATGNASDVNGTVHLHVANINGRYEFPAMPDKCSDHLLLDLDIGIGAFNLDGTVDHGAAHASASLNNPNIRLQKSGNDTCDWGQGFDLTSSTVVAGPVCWIPFIGGPICHTVDKLVPITVHIPVIWEYKILTLDVGVKANSVSVSLAGQKKTSVCVSGAHIDDVIRPEWLTVLPTLQAHSELEQALKQALDLAWQTSAGAMMAALESSVVNIGSIVTTVFPISACG